MEVAVTPTDVPLLHVLIAVTLLCDADEVDRVLDTVLCTRSCQPTTVTLMTLMTLMTM